MKVISNIKENRIIISFYFNEIMLCRNEKTSSHQHYRITILLREKIECYVIFFDYFALHIHVGKDIEVPSSDNVDTIHTDIKTSDMFADMIR